MAVDTTRHNVFCKKYPNVCNDTTIRISCLFPRGTLSPLDTPPVPKKPGAITPSPLHGRGGSGHVSRGRGIKVRQSWTFMGNFMRRSAERLSCLFCRRQNAAGNCARRAQKRHAVGVPFRLIEFALQIPARRPLTLKKFNESKSGGVYLGFYTSGGRKFPYGNFRTTRVLRSQNTDCRRNVSFATVSYILPPLLPSHTPVARADR